MNLRCVFQCTSARPSLRTLWPQGNPLIGDLHLGPTGPTTAKVLKELWTILQILCVFTCGIANITLFLSQLKIRAGVIFFKWALATHQFQTSCSEAEKAIEKTALGSRQGRSSRGHEPSQTVEVYVSSHVSLFRGDRILNVRQHKIKYFHPRFWRYD